MAAGDQWSHQTPNSEHQCLELKTSLNLALVAFEDQGKTEELHAAFWLRVTHSEVSAGYVVHLKLHVIQIARQGQHVCFLLLLTPSRHPRMGGRQKRFQTPIGSKCDSTERDLSHRVAGTAWPTPHVEFRASKSYGTTAKASPSFHLDAGERFNVGPCLTRHSRALYLAASPPTDQPGALKRPLLRARRGASSGGVGSAVCCAQGGSSRRRERLPGLLREASQLTIDAAFMLTGSVLSPANSLHVSRQQQQAAVSEGKQQQHHAHICGSDSLSEVGICRFRRTKSCTKGAAAAAAAAPAVGLPAGALLQQQHQQQILSVRVWLSQQCGAFLGRGHGIHHSCSFAAAAAAAAARASSCCRCFGSEAYPLGGRQLVLPPFQEDKSLLSSLVLSDERQQQLPQRLSLPGCGRQKGGCQLPALSSQRLNALEQPLQQSQAATAAAEQQQHFHARA
ncbi:hypothetical protein Efla_007605 [Eimeria flavescens]